MKTFQCDCAGEPTLFFESSRCNACGRLVGVDENFDRVEPYEFDDVTGHYFKAADPTVFYQKCDNNAQYQTCNGMLRLNETPPNAVSSAEITTLVNEGADSTLNSNTSGAEKETRLENQSNESAEAPVAEIASLGEKPEVLCFACRFNNTIPDLSVDGHIPLWKKMETAKRRALFTLNALPLPLDDLTQDFEGGLSFDFITDRNVGDHFLSPIKHQDVVFTGHDSGHITINLAEADDVARSSTKMAMGERYRTLLGHFRHELGHYYFEKLILNNLENHALCKQYFGDDELDYQEAIDRHYKEGAPSNWRENYISEYATMHPYEDWAETWAHYMHIIDTLETAQNFSITGSTSGEELDNEEVGELHLPQGESDFFAQTPINGMIDTWIDFSVILNSLNRSMGLEDAYPFVLTQSVRTKLAFVHYAIHDRLGELPPATNSPI